MGREMDQRYGNGPKDGSFKGEFTRSGEESQFHHELKEETINFVLKKFVDFKKIYPDNKLILFIVPLQTVHHL